MCIPIFMIIGAVWLGWKYRDKFEVNHRYINDKITMDEYKHFFDITDEN